MRWFLFTNSTSLTYSISSFKQCQPLTATENNEIRISYGQDKPKPKITKNYEISLWYQRPFFQLYCSAFLLFIHHLPYLKTHKKPQKYRVFFSITHPILGLYLEMQRTRQILPTLTELSFWIPFKQPLVFKNYFKKMKT